MAGAGSFGAALMMEPELVAACASGIAAGGNGSIPVTVKCRIGVDHHQSYDQLCNFVSVGATHFVATCLDVISF